VQLHAVQPHAGTREVGLKHTHQTREGGVITVQLHAVQPARASLLHVFEEDAEGYGLSASTTAFIFQFSPIIFMGPLVKGDFPPAPIHFSRESFSYVCPSDA
jgi:hypothetical protein